MNVRRLFQMEFLHCDLDYIVWGDFESVWVKNFHPGTFRWKKSTLVISDSEFRPNIEGLIKALWKVMSVLWNHYNLQKNIINQNGKYKVLLGSKKLCIRNLFCCEVRCSEASAEIPNVIFSIHLCVCLFRNVSCTELAGIELIFLHSSWYGAVF